MESLHLVIVNAFFPDFLPLEGMQMLYPGVVVQKEFFFPCSVHVFCSFFRVCQLGSQ